MSVYCSTCDTSISLLPEEFITICKGCSGVLHSFSKTVVSTRAVTFDDIEKQREKFNKRIKDLDERETDLTADVIGFHPELKRQLKMMRAARWQVEQGLRMLDTMEEKKNKDMAAREESDEDEDEEVSEESDTSEESLDESIVLVSGEEKENESDKKQEEEKEPTAKKGSKSADTASTQTPSLEPSKLPGVVTGNSLKPACPALGGIDCWPPGMFSVSSIQPRPYLSMSMLGGIDHPTSSTGHHYSSGIMGSGRMDPSMSYIGPRPSYESMGGAEMSHSNPASRSMMEQQDVSRPFGDMGSMRIGERGTGMMSGMGQTAVPAMGQTMYGRQLGTTRPMTSTMGGTEATTGGGHPETTPSRLAGMQPDMPRGMYFYE